MKQLYNRHFPTPSYLGMNSCALDISDRSIKYGEIFIKSKGLRLGRYGKEDVPEGVMYSGRIENEEKFVEILKKLKKKLNLKFVRVALPEEQMYLFTLKIPQVEQKNLRDIIVLQIEEHIPLKAIDTVFDYDVISEDDQNILVQVLAISASIIEGYLSVFERAGLTPLSFELEAEAIARAVVPHGEKKPIMIVDFGNERTGVSIFCNGRVFFTTTLDIGGVNLTNMISKNFAISFEKAEEMKRNYGIDSTGNNDIFSVILNDISVLRDELNKQYIYWDSHKNLGISNENIDHIILCGGDSNLNGLSEYLEASMKVKVTHANVWINISDMNDSVPSMSLGESLSYATVLGLALGDYLYKNNIINVLPEAQRNNLKKEYWMRFVSVCLNILTLVFFIASTFLLPAYLFSKSKEESANNSLNQFNIENPDITNENLDKSINDLNSKLDLILKNQSKKQPLMNILNEVISLKTEGITFSQVFYNEKDNKIYIDIYGQARNRNNLSNFKTILENNPKYQDFELPVSSFLEKTDINFKISILVKENA